MKKIYVGNLPFSATEEEITALFSEYGTVHSVALINDREPGRPRGSGSSPWWRWPLGVSTAHTVTWTPLLEGSGVFLSQPKN